MIRLVIQRQRGPAVVLELVSLEGRWSRGGFESRCGHFRFLCTLFLFSFRFCCLYFFLWLVFLYSHPWAFTASRDFCDNSFLVYVRWRTGEVARGTGSVFWYLNSPASILNIYVCAKSSILDFQHSWTLSWLLSRNWAFFTFWATIKHFNFFYNFPHVKCNMLSLKRFQ